MFEQIQYNHDTFLMHDNVQFIKKICFDGNKNNHVCGATMFQYRHLYLIVKKDTETIIWRYQNKWERISEQGKVIHKDASLPSVQPSDFKVITKNFGLTYDSNSSMAGFLSVVPRSSEFTSYSLAGVECEYDKHKVIWCPYDKFILIEVGGRTIFLTMQGVRSFKKGVHEEVTTIVVEKQNTIEKTIPLMNALEQCAVFTPYDFLIWRNEEYRYIGTNIKEVLQKKAKVTLRMKYATVIDRNVISLPLVTCPFERRVSVLVDVPPDMRHLGVLFRLSENDSWLFISKTNKEKVNTYLRSK